MTDPTALSYWLPKIHAAGLPVPKTIIVPMNEQEVLSIWASMDGQDGPVPLTDFYERIGDAADQIGYPCFLRTDHTSAKHNWRDTCYLENAAQIPFHVMEIFIYGEMASFVGIPIDVWAVREFLPTIPWGVCTAYGDMPVCREYRFFVRDGKVVCWHPYWPQKALDDGAIAHLRPFNYEEFVATTSDEARILTELAEKAGAALGGAWSIDFLETKNGWYLTDMAEAGKSFHMPGCPHEDEFPR